MKYGRTYDKLLAQHAEWQAQSVPYKQLKKLINNIAEELEALGLNAETVADLLHQTPPGSPTISAGANKSPTRTVTIGKGKRKARAQYELGGDGDAEHPEPRIRIIFSSASEEEDETTDDDFEPGQLQRRPSSSSTQSAFLEELDEHSSGDDAYHSSALVQKPGSSMFGSELLMRMYGKGNAPAHEVQPPDSPHTPTSSPPLTPRQRQKSKAEDPVDAMLAASLMLPPVLEMRQDGSVESDTDSPPSHTPLEPGSDADDEAVTPRLNGHPHLKPPAARRRKHRPHKELVISLDKDTQFFALLGGALHSLEQLELQQKAVFAQDTSSLASRITHLSSPSKPKSDLYGWREVFALWIEADIFQGHTERDRKERSVEETERRLQWFVDQVGRRKLAKKMRNKDSAAALEQFVALNVQLLDLKRFQEANELAARKILKKHDKRTALTALSDFPIFVQATHHMNEKPRHLILPGSPSLPHLLLMQFTTALLPIVPQVEDYSCIICGDIAYKPIKLDCSHRFCVRCLVKMQKRGQNACPSCRAPVVLTANAANLDAALQSWMKLYFPKEVKAKSGDNGREAGKEQMQEMGLGDSRCVVM